MKHFFKDKLDWEKFNNQGYAILDLQDKSIPSRLQELYYSLNINSKGQDLYASNRYGSSDENIVIQKGVLAILEEEMKYHLMDYNVLIAHFIEKKASTLEGFQLHQDWSITDEKKYSSAHVWIPLQNTSVENGCLYILPCSHLFFNNYRSGSLDIPRIKENFFLNRITRSIPLKKGEMIIFHPALFHGSYSNKTNQPRIAALLNVIQTNAPLQYYHLNEKEEVAVYSLTQRALMEDLDKMIRYELPNDSNYITNLGKRKIINSEISTKDIFMKYLKSMIDKNIFA